jgi:class 3 adenylate cyclase
MGMMMKIIMAMMYMLPKKLRDRMKSPMMQKGRYAAGKNHPAIEMNLTNLLVCARNCGTCPSYSGVRGEALFCASGPSKIDIEQNGCNCVTCPIFDKCSGYSTAYFCINGQCSPRDTRSALMKLTDLAKAYLQRFTFQDEGESGLDLDDAVRAEALTGVEVKEVTMDFIGDKEVETTSNVPILRASLESGIPHTHICGGRARCSTCRIIVMDGLEYCRPRNERESRLARIKGFSPEVRLACQTTTEGDISLRRLVLDDRDISEAISQGRANPNEVGREADVTILFSDIRSFTSFSEKALPYDVIHILNRYFEAIGGIIDTYGGYIDKYMGDGIMVIFGLDREMKEGHAVLAAHAALGIREALGEFNEYLESHFSHTFNIGIGLHSGNVIVGNLGFSKKKEYTAIGDTVNTASRIESLNKRTGTSILVSESTYRLIHSKFIWGKAYKTKVKGREEPVIVHELTGTKR